MPHPAMRSRARDFRRDNPERVMVEGMVANGVPRFQAVAVVNALTHALGSPDFQEQYGTFSVEHLNAFVNAAGAVAA